MAVEILMPALSPTMEEGTLAKWLVKEGDVVKSGQIIAEIETDKATMEFEAVDEGKIGRILVAEGTAGVKVNTPIAVLIEDGEAADAVPAAAKAVAVAAPVVTAVAAPAAVVAAKPGGGRGLASPIVRADVEGVQAVAAVAVAVAAPVAMAAPAAVSAPVAAMASGPSTDVVLKTYADRPFTQVKLDGMRKTIAARLTEAKQTVPHFYLRRDIELDALMAFRAQLNAKLESRGVKLSVNDFIIKACALALQQVPAANAVWAGDRVLQFKKSDVAVAVAIEGGLFTPVLKDAEAKSLSALSAEMKDLAKRARDRKLAPHEYQGGSFAISNLGMFGIDNFDAIINPPHAAILAVGAGVQKPIVKDEIAK